MTRRTHASVCPHDCPSACALEVTTEDGRIVDVAGDRAHPFTRGVICGKVHDYAERVYSPLRVLRAACAASGRRATADFEPISWDEAIEEIAHRWHADHRPVGRRGDPAVLLRRHAGPGPVLRRPPASSTRSARASSTGRSASRPPTRAGGPRVGVVAGNDSEQMVGADLVVLWGINAAYTHINVMTLVKEARARGARVVCIDPYRTPTARQADEHLMIRVRDGRGAGARPDARPDRARTASTTTTSRARRSASSALAEHVRAYPPERVARDHRAAARTRSSASRAATARRAPRIIRVGHRALAPRERRHDVPDASPACPRSPAPTPTRTAARCSGAPGAFGPGDAVLERRDLLPVAAAAHRSTWSSSGARSPIRTSRRR